MKDNFLKRFIKYIFFLKNIQKRIEKIEYRSVNRRFYAIEQATEYLLGAQIPGDYLEFGVYEGTTFSYACNMMSPYFQKMKFIALDSFEGLPEPKGIDAKDGFTSQFYETQYTCSKNKFIEKITKAEVDLKKVIIVKGWFDESLKPKNIEKYKINKIAAAWVDCDLYESTVPVLNFLTSRITVGTIILFDDWHCFRNHPDFGQQKACREWLAKNRKIKLAKIFSFGWNGAAFTVVSC